MNDKWFVAFILVGLIAFSFGCVETINNRPGPDNETPANVTQNATIPAEQNITEPGIQNGKPETQDSKPGTVNWTPVTGNWTLIKVPDPLAGDNPPYLLIPRNVPAAGENFADLRFGTNLTRVTQTKGIRHEYSRFDPFNRDQSMITLLEPETGDWKVYKTQDLPYDKTGNLVRTLDLEDPRWDPNATDMI